MFLELTSGPLHLLLACSVWLLVIQALAHIPPPQRGPSFLTPLAHFIFFQVLSPCLKLPSLLAYFLIVNSFTTAEEGTDTLPSCSLLCPHCLELSADLLMEHTGSFGPCCESSATAPAEPGRRQLWAASFRNTRHARPGGVSASASTLCWPCSW